MVHDFVGVGFGPSNIALAVAAREIAPELNGLFLERADEVAWHPGILFDGSRMQVSFLKDLASLRNPSSRFSFLHYARARGRLERFANLREFHPGRLEYQDYLRWAASHFEDRTRYGVEVIAARPAASRRGGPYDRIEIKARPRAGGEEFRLKTENLVIATGGRQSPPPGCETAGDRLILSGEFLHRFDEIKAQREAPLEVIVAGDGQSAGEIALHLMDALPRARIRMLARGFSLRPADSSAFVNEVFSSTHGAAFRAASPAKREAWLADVRNTNYGVIDDDVLNALYQRSYEREVTGAPPLEVTGFSKLAGARDTGDALEVVIEDRVEGGRETARCDLVIAAAGYERKPDEAVFGDILSLLRRGEDGAPRVDDAHRAVCDPRLQAGVYLQGFCQGENGVAETLLSNLPFRAGAIAHDLKARRAASRRAPAYPPARHVHDDEAVMYALMERYRFAVLVSADDYDVPMVTELPLMLERDRDGRAVLFGHLDRSNPHVAAVDGRRVTAVFRGPNAYISPHVYETDHLPTWNSMSVHVRGRARLIGDQDRLVAGLCSICEHADPSDGAYRLDPADPRIARLIDYIVGFEIEIEEMTGRFKLSQDRDPPDQRHAAAALIRDAQRDPSDLVHAIIKPAPDRKTALNPAGA